jgi:hypothetical protein
MTAPRRGSSTNCARENLWAKGRVVTDYFSDTALEQSSISRDQVLMFQKNFKEFVKHYQRLHRLPGPAKKLAVKATDGFLTWGRAPKVMRWIAPKRRQRDRRDEAAALDTAC